MNVSPPWIDPLHEILTINLALLFFKQLTATGTECLAHRADDSQLVSIDSSIMNGASLETESTEGSASSFCF